MAKTKQPVRKPVKARGALPSPRVAPQRDTTPWHQKTKYRVAIGVAVLLLLALAAKLVLDARDRAEQRRRDIRSIEQFERKVQDLNLEIQPTYEAIGQVPGAFLAGALPPAEYRTQAESWVQGFRQLNRGIRSLEVPARLESLQEAKASYVQGTTIYIDAAKMFVSAADAPDPGARERATVLARNTLLHGAAIYGMGDRALTQLRNEYDLNDPPRDVPAPTLPEEEVSLPPPPPPPAGVAPGPATVAPPAPGPAPPPAASTPSPAAS